MSGRSLKRWGRLLAGLPAAAQGALHQALIPVAAREAVIAHERARREGYQLGLTTDETEEIIAAAVERSKVSADPVDWPAVRRAMVDRVWQKTDLPRPHLGGVTSREILEHWPETMEKLKQTGHSVHDWRPFTTDGDGDVASDH